MTREDVIRMALEHFGAVLKPSDLEVKLAMLAVAAEREKVAAWMRSKSYATGHGDTTEDLLKELEWQVAEREREACAKVCESEAAKLGQSRDALSIGICAAAIRARGET